MNYLYASRACLYDRIYSFKDYAAEASRLVELLRQHNITEGSRVLEVACGTGNFLLQLRKSFRMTGLDISEDMLREARRKLPADVDLLQGDMCTFHVEEPADSLLCLFSSIGYLDPKEQLPAAAKTFYENLRPGGVLLVEPWLTPEAVKPNHFEIQTYDGDDMKLARGITPRHDGRRSNLEFHWLVSTAEKTEHFVEHHQLWMSTREELTEIFVGAGFGVSWVLEGLRPSKTSRGVLVGVKGQ